VANKAHLKILEQGVKHWNDWRDRTFGVIPDLREAKLDGAVLTGANLTGADLILSDFTGATLEHANFQWANFTNANLSGADLNGTYLMHANLGRSILKNANLKQASLSSVILSGADLTGADMREAQLDLVDLSRAKLEDADFTDSEFQGVILANLDLRKVKGLDRVKHSAASSIGIDTIYRSGGNIPEVFLRGAGVPEPFIANMKALVAAMSPIEFYSCFISYSSKDQEFAERLYADLQNKRVRCWFAPEDLKIGDRLRPAFDEAIRVHDKLMVLLSESSVSSPWVEKEVETAFEKERREKRTVLFPIRLDEAVMETGEAWAADIRRTRHIGDFRDWKNHDSYKKAFERLLRDLKASS
jgi:uncharacterized protein YjbI with pentapeptide repeats